MNSRIKRRNACWGNNGKLGIGNHSDFNAHHSFGDYRLTYDRIAAEKYLGEYNALVHFAVLCGIKHAGSKTLKQLRNALK